LQTFVLFLSSYFFLFSRAAAIQHFAKVTTVLRPHADAAPESGNSTRWPRSSQAYCVYTRRSQTKGDVQGLVTFGLSNPYQNTFFFAIGQFLQYLVFFFDQYRIVAYRSGIGIEIVMEAAPQEARLSDAKGDITGPSIGDSWMFAVLHELAHQCFSLGLQIRQLLEKVVKPCFSFCLSNYLLAFFVTHNSCNYCRWKLPVQSLETIFASHLSFFC
jgi:hypothetical protein